MPAEILDGRALARRTRKDVRVRAKRFKRKHGRAPGLDVVLVGDDPASQVYVGAKERMAGKCHIEGRVHRLPVETPMDALLALIATLNADENVDGILVQLPLPSHLDEGVVVDAIDPRKDVDGLHPVNAGALVVGRSGLTPCTPTGCMRFLEDIEYDLSGKRALVVGRSILVGKPVALMLLAKNATVSIAHSRTKDLESRVRESDVIVAAVGRPELIQGAWLKEGAVVIDVGINRLEPKEGEAPGTLVGDVDFAEAQERAGYITPVPGGVGPMTIAILLENTVLAAERRNP